MRGKPLQDGQGTFRWAVIEQLRLLGESSADSASYAAYLQHYNAITVGVTSNDRAFREAWTKIHEPRFRDDFLRANAHLANVYDLETLFRDHVRFAEVAEITASLHRNGVLGISPVPEDHEGLTDEIEFSEEKPAE